MVLPKDADQQSSINGGRTLEEPLLTSHNEEVPAAAQVRKIHTKVQKYCDRSMFCQPTDDAAR